jgi:hypothetical protein
MDMKHPALAEAKDFHRNLAGDLRSFNKTLRQDDESQLAVEDVANSLHSALQELIAGHAPRPETPGRPLADIGARPPEPEAVVDQAAPEDQSQAALLLAKLNGAA